MLALSTTLSMITPALALQAPSLPSGGASVFVDDVRVSAGEPATAKIHVKHDNTGVQTGMIKFDIPAATTGIATGTQLRASCSNVTALPNNGLKTTGVGTLGWRSPTEYFTETDIELTVPKVSATTKIGMKVTAISGRAQDSTLSDKIDLDKVNAVSGSFIVQYPVAVALDSDSRNVDGASIKVNTTAYNGKATFDKNSKTQTDVSTGGTFYVDSGAGQQNAPVLNFKIPQDYYAEVTVNGLTKNTVGTAAFTLSEITAATTVSVKLIKGSIPSDTISTANITYQYGKYVLGTDTKQFDKDGAEKAVAPKNFTADGYSVYAYKLNGGAETAIVAGGTVDVELTQDTNTVVFLYKRNDNSTVLPGVDKKIPTDDDITVKPADDTADALVPDTDGAVTFPTDGKGGTVSDKKGNSMVVPGGTKVDEAGNIYLPDSTDPVKPGDPNTVPAGWYQITYKYENTKLFIQLGKENETVEALDWPSSVEKPAGKAFDGWNTMNSGVGGERVSVKDSISGPKTLYAQWKDDYGQNKITITFYPNLKKDETAADAATQVIGNSQDTTFIATLTPDKTFTKDGWTLAGWNEQQNGSGTTHKVNGQIRRELAAGNLSLYAMWTKTGDNSITVPGKDGIPGNTDDATANGSATQKPERKDDGTIDVPNGGSVTEGGKEYPMPNGGTLKPNGDIIIKQPDNNGSIVVKPDGSTEVLKPNGDKDDTKNAFKVTYKSGEAGMADKIVPAVDSIQVMSGDKLFAYAGHKFAYWTKPAGDTVERVAVNTVLRADTELTAHWYKVGDNGEIIVKPNPDENKEIVVKPDPTDPTNPDKKPKVDEDGNVVVPPGGEVEKKPDGGTITLPDGGVVTPGGDIKVPDKNGDIVDPSNPGTLPTGYFQIVYNANGGKGEMEKQTGKTITVKANGFKHDTLTFAGWNTKKNGSGKGYAPNTEATAADADVDAKTKTLTLYAIWVKKDDNGAITVPGKDGSIDPDTGKDNVTVKPNPDKPEEKPIQKPDGSIEIPSGGSGVIETPDKEPIVVPGGSVIKPDGTIEVPKTDGSDGKDTIDPSNPDQLPNGYFIVTYKSGKDADANADADFKQIAKNGDKALSGAIFTAPAGKEFVNWKVQDADQSYNANEPMNLTEKITLVAKWRNQGSGTTTYSAVVKYYNGKNTTPIKDEFTSDSDPMQRTLKNAFASEEKNGWKLLGYNGNDGKFYQPTQSISLKNHDVLELYAVWSKDDGNGTIVVPGPDGKPGTTDDITIKPNPEKPDEKPAVDGKGDVKVPDGGQITIPGKDNGEDTTVTVKPSATVKPDGTIVLPEGGTITVPGKDGKDDTVITGPGNFDPDKITNPEFNPDKPYKPGNGTVVLPGPDKKNGTDDDVIVTPTAPDKSEIDDKGQVTLPDGGKVNFPQPPAGNGAEVTVPNGTVITPDGVIKIPEGGTGSIKYPDGTEINPLPGGTEIKPDGSIKLPDGENGGAVIKKPDGSVIEVPGGTEIDKDGNITIPDNGSGTIKPKPDGSETDTVPGGATIDKDGRYRYLVSLKSANGVALKAPNGYKTTIWLKKGETDVVVAPVIDNYTLSGESKFEVTGGQKVNDSYTITFTYQSVAGGGSSGGGGGGSVTSYVITASAGNGGSISPNGNVSVVRGSDKVFTITAKDGYRISNVIVDGESVGAVSTYTFRNVTTKHTIAASFIKVSEIPIIGPGDTGVDKWLRTDEHNSYITGYGNGLFGPENSVTRAQIAQIFYRLLKDQNVTATVNFSDVKPDAWYAEAVNALGSLGIISGVGKGKFDPDRAITRAEFCAVAARFAKVNSSADCPFDDVNTRDWYYQAVATAASYGWVTGMSDGSFHPNNVISRAQAATIINRMLGAAADRDFVDSHVSNPYKDVSPSYWAYYQIIEASIPHNHSYNAENVEIWNGLK